MNLCWEVAHARTHTVLTPGGGALSQASHSKKQTGGFSKHVLNRHPNVSDDSAERPHSGFRPKQSHLYCHILVSSLSRKKLCAAVLVDLSHVSDHSLPTQTLQRRIGFHGSLNTSQLIITDVFTCNKRCSTGIRSGPSHSHHLHS